MYKGLIASFVTVFVIISGVMVVSAMSYGASLLSAILFALLVWAGVAGAILVSLLAVGLVWGILSFWDWVFNR